MKKTIISILLITLLQNCGSSTTYNPPVQETVNVSPLKAEEQTRIEENTSEENSIDDEYTYVVDRSSSAKTNQKSKNNKMLIYVVGGIVIAVAIAGTILFFRNNKAQAETVAKATKSDGTASKVVETVVDVLTKDQQIRLIRLDIEGSKDLSETLVNSFKNRDREVFETAVAVVAGDNPKIFGKILAELNNIKNVSEIPDGMAESLIEVIKKVAQSSLSIDKGTWKTALQNPKVKEALVKVAKEVKANAEFFKGYFILKGVHDVFEVILAFTPHAH